MTFTQQEAHLTKLASDLTKYEVAYKNYTMQKFLSLGATAILTTLSIVSLKSNVANPTDFVVAFGSTAFLTLMAAGYNKLRQDQVKTDQEELGNIINNQLQTNDIEKIHSMRDNMIEEELDKYSIVKQISKVRQSYHQNDVILGKLKL